MNYIGSKKTLSNFILGSINDIIPIKDAIFADLFSGTGIISKKALDYNPKKIIINDLQEYASIYSLSNLLSKDNLKLKYFKGKTLLEIEKEINNIKEEKGFFYKNLSPFSKNHSKYERMFFTKENAIKIDTVRNFLLKNKNKFSKNEFVFLMGSLIDSMDKVANTTSIYGAYLKKFKKTAQKKFLFKLIDLNDKNIKVETFNNYIEKIIKNLKGDILYLDPPYNTRRYSSNYHILELLVNNKLEIRNNTKTALIKNVNKSDFCSKRNVKKSFKFIIENSNFKSIFISYSSDGIIEVDEILSMLKEKYSEVGIISKEYKRFKADNSKDRTYSDKNLKEFIIYGI